MVSDDESESWSSSKGTQLREIGRSGQYVVVLQEIEPKVHFPSPTRFIYIVEVALKLLLKHGNPNTTILGLTKTKYNDDTLQDPLGRINVVFNHFTTYPSYIR